MEVNCGPSVVALRDFLSFAVLEFEVPNEVDLQPAPILHDAAEEGGAPSAGGVARLSAASTDPLAEQLREDVGEMHRLGAGQLQPLPTQLRHLPQQPLMVRGGPLKRCPCQKSHRMAALGLHVQRRRVPHFPILGGPRSALHGLPHGCAAKCALLAANIGPRGEIEHEVQQLVLAGVVRDGAQGFGKKVALETLPARRVHVLLLACLVLRPPVVVRLS